MTRQLIAPIDRQLKDKILTSLRIMYYVITLVGSPCVSYMPANILAFSTNKINSDMTDKADQKMFNLKRLLSLYTHAAALGRSRVGKEPAQAQDYLKYQIQLIQNPVLSPSPFPLCKRCLRDGRWRALGNMTAQKPEFQGVLFLTRHLFQSQLSQAPDNSKENSHTHEG